LPLGQAAEAAQSNLRLSALTRRATCEPAGELLAWRRDGPEGVPGKPPAGRPKRESPIWTGGGVILPFRGGQDLEVWPKSKSAIKPACCHWR
jgi:hypothetical protein